MESLDLSAYSKLNCLVRGEHLCNLMIKDLENFFFLLILLLVFYEALNQFLNLSQHVFCLSKMSILYNQRAYLINGCLVLSHSK